MRKSIEKSTETISGCRRMGATSMWAVDPRPGELGRKVGAIERELIGVEE